MALDERIWGCLLGGAIGDAVASPHEGTRGRKLDLVTAPDEYANRWQLTDDTQLTLATCQALVRTGVNPEGIANSFLEWYRGRRLRGLDAGSPW